MKAVNIKGKEYVEVNERIKHFRSHFTGWSLESEVLSHEDGKILIKATIRDAEGCIKATGLAQEKEGDGFINKTSYVENCETSAWGRALGNLGIGIDGGIASAEEVGNAIMNQGDKPQLTQDKISEVVKWLTDGGKWEVIETKYIVDDKLKSEIMDIVDNG